MQAWAALRGGILRMMTKSPAIGAVVVVGGALFIAAFAAVASANWTSAKPARNLTLVYVGADNCAPCEMWQRNQGAAFRDSPEFHRLAYREVKSPNLFDVLKDNNWPEELRAYRQAIGEGAGVPLWLVIADDQIVMQSYGLTQWQEAVLPKIKSLLR
jgi:hypothetical protein